MDKPDQQLLERFRNGEEKAFREIYDCYKEPVIKFSCSIIKDGQEAENLYHDVMLKIWKRRESINPELNFTYYLFTSIKNQLFDYLKEVKKDGLLKSAFLEKMAALQDEGKEDKEEKLQKLESLVQALTPKRRAIVELAFSLGKSYEEIARQLFISKNTVKNHLIQIKLILRKGIG
jgi:RNA polymerase sigma factor (sigma-70 family)